MRNVLIIIGLLFLTFSMAGQEAVLNGLAPEYSGRELIFSSYNNFITKELKEVGRCMVSQNGEFSCSIYTDEVIDIHLIDGIYDGSLLIEPGRKYNIKLPPSEAKSFKERSNPFFEEIRYYIGYSDTIENDLNIKVLEINRDIEYFISENYYNFIYGKPQRQKVDSFVIEINNIYPSEQNKFLNSFLNYKLANLKFISRYYNLEKTASEYFYKSPVLYNNEAYMVLFNQVFSDFFRSFPHNSTSESYSSIINYDKGLSILIERINSNLEIDNLPLTELLIMKGLFDGFYNNDYIVENVNPLLDSIIVSSNGQISIDIAINIKKSINHLLPGTLAPEFKLYDKDSNLIDLTEYRGKYVYLNFCSYQSSASRRELSFIPNLQKKLKKKIVFVSISVDETFSDFLNHINKNNYRWSFLSINNQPEILKSYKVKSYPTSFLIDPYGKLLLVPALLPSEGFVNQFYGVLNKRN